MLFATASVLVLPELRSADKKKLPLCLGVFVVQRSFAFSDQYAGIVIRQAQNQLMTMAFQRCGYAGDFSGSRHGIAFFAIRACKWPFTRVEAVMYSQMAWFGKSFAAQHAYVWLFTRVDALV